MEWGHIWSYRKPAEIMKPCIYLYHDRKLHLVQLPNGWQLRCMKSPKWCQIARKCSLACIRIGSWYVLKQSSGNENVHGIGQIWLTNPQSIQARMAYDPKKTMRRTVSTVGVKSSIVLYTIGQHEPRQLGIKDGVEKFFKRTQYGYSMDAALGTKTRWRVKTDDALHNDSTISYTGDAK